MTGFEMFWPLVAHALLVFSLYGLLRIRRRGLVAAGKMSNEDIRWGGSEPENSRVVNNCIANQFELPVLFHLCCVLLYITQADNLPAVILAWAFVGSRYLHALVHVTNNRLTWRFPLFMAGFVLLAAMWAWLIVWMATS